MVEDTNQIRKCDDFGRVHLPKEVRQTLKIEEGCNLKILMDTEKNQVILQKIGGKINENN